MMPPQELTTAALIHGMIACRVNAGELITDADLLAEKGRFPRAYALLHTACEELGKFAVLEIAARGLFQGKPPKWKKFWQRFRSHDSKSAQLEVQLQMLAAPSSGTDDFSDLAELLFSGGLHVRNAALYADLGPNGSFRQPSDIDFDIPIAEFRALAAHALAAAQQRGLTPKEIETHLKTAPTFKQLRSVEFVMVKILERMRDSGIPKEKIIEIINSRYK